MGFFCCLKKYYPHPIIQSIWYYAALALGLFTIIVWTYRTCCVLGRSLGFGTRCTTARYGKDSWAVVTGATDGIGKSAAINLACQGFNIVLISRTLAKLEAVAQEVKEAAKAKGKTINTRIVQLDFTKTYDAATFAKIYKEHLQELEVSVLLNNVGMSGAHGIDFFENNEQDVHNIMTCNMYANVLLTREVIVGMKARYEKTGKRAAIVFTSAMASIVPVPGIGLYSASKIFTDFITWGLTYELTTKYKIDVSAWRAAGVSTNMTKNEETSIMVRSSDDYANDALGKMTS